MSQQNDFWSRIERSAQPHSSTQVAVVPTVDEATPEDKARTKRRRLRRLLDAIAVAA